MNRVKQKQRSGLKAVLWVLSVIVLIMLLFPVLVNPLSNPLYAGNYGNYRRSACASNMKQLGLALDQYSQDENGEPPPIISAKGQGWREAIYPYVKSTGCYRCPDDKRNSAHDLPDDLPKSYTSNQAVLYGRLASASPASIAAVDTRGCEGEDWNMTSPTFLPGTGRSCTRTCRGICFMSIPQARSTVCSPTVMLSRSRQWRR